MVFKPPEVVQKIINRFKKYYKINYNLKWIILDQSKTIRNSKLIIECRICKAIKTIPGSKLYLSASVKAHNCKLNKEYNFKLIKEKIKNKLKKLKKQGKFLELINFNFQWFKENYTTAIKTKITLRCKKHQNNIIQISINNFLNDSINIGCKICASERASNFFRKEINIVYENVQKYFKELELRYNTKFKFPDENFFKKNYKNSRTYFPVYCIKHHFLNKKFSYMRVRNKSNPCPFCSQKLLNYEEFLKKAKLIHQDYKYLISKQWWIDNYQNRKTKIKIFCERCKVVFNQRIENHLDGYGCSFCSISKGERKIKQFLEKKKINFEYQKYIKSLKLFFDFFIYERNIAIEYDGELHYKSVEYFGGDKTLKKQQKLDQIKNQYCKENNIKLIRIPYWEYDNIEKILEKELLCI